MKVVYIAGPITHGDRLANVTKAIEWAHHLAEAGFAPLCPHLTHYWDELFPREYESWMAMDFAYIAKCDALIRIPGYSPGADREVVEAKRLGILVVDSIPALLASLNPAQ